MGRIFHRLDLLVLLGCNRYGRRGGDHGLCSVLVPLDLSDWVASLAVIVLLLTLNLATVKMFGEMQLPGCDDQIVAIVSLIVVGLVMVAMHFQSPTGVEASFAHLWNDGGWFPKGLKRRFLPDSDSGFRFRRD